MLGFPIEVLMGQLSQSELQIGFAFQSGWLLAAFVLFITVWRKGVRRYAAVGG
jgi:ABC-2 type transport system permease protein